MRNESCLHLAIVIAILVLAIGGTLGHAYFEARAYERVTGKKVSTWDAIFLQLRVQEESD